MRTSALVAFCLALLISLPGTSCSLPGHVKGSGPTVRRPIEVAPFHGIVLAGSMDVRLTKGGTQTVELEGQENIIALVSTEVKGGVWHIRTKENYSTDKPFTVHITVPLIDDVRVDGSGDVVGDGEFETEKVQLGIAGSGNLILSFSAKSARATIDGSGSMRLNGKSDAFAAAIAGSGDVNASKLVVIDLKADIAGSGSISADASGQVTADIAGSGNVELMRKPANITRRVDGSGGVHVH